MSRSDDLDRLYGVLIFLCDEARFLNPGTQYAVMLAFNLVSELHAPGRLVIDHDLDLDDALERAAELAETLTANASGIDELLRLRTVRSLLGSALHALSSGVRDPR
jgi:hypothetical protein